MSLDRQQVLDRLEEANGGPRDLSGLDLSGADLSRMDLRGVNLSRADLSSADLRWAILEGADLHSTILRRADVRWAVMRGANLRQADLGRANLGWADVSGADLSGADLDGASLENVDLSASVMERPAYLGGAAARPMRGSAAPRSMAVPAAAAVGGGGVLARPMPAPWARPAWLPEGLALPQVTPAQVALVVFGTLAVVHLWGWLYRRAYYVDGFQLKAPGIVDLGQWSNLASGLGDVVLLTLKTLLAAPLVLLAIALVLGAVLAPVVLLWFFGERVLGDVVRPQMRPVVVGGLFVAYTVLFVLFIIPGLIQIWDWIGANGMPGDAGLRMVFSLFQIGGVITKLGLLATLAACAVPLWAAWRWLSHWIVGYEPPLEWRLRYPALNSTIAGAREAWIFHRSEPLAADERRRALLTLGGIVLALATLLTGAGRVQALGDMCDGGDLPRLQLYFGEVPASIQPGTLCQRLVAETDDTYFVFFPSQTRERTPGDLASREANLRAIEKTDDIQARRVSGDSDWCPSCGNPNGEEVFIVYPNQVQARGRVTENAGNLVLMDVEEGQLGTLRLSDTTQITLDGGPAGAADIVPGASLVAFGAAAADDPNILEAREVNILPATSPGAPDLPPATLDVALGDPRNPVFSGGGWTAGNTVEVRLVKPAPGAEPAANTAGIPLLPSVTVGPDGTFSAPVVYREGMPTGADYTVIAVDARTGQVARSASGWLQVPPPTLTPPPTAPPPRPTEETTATPEGGSGDETATPEASETSESDSTPTNTAFPTRPFPGGFAPTDCDPDEHEFDGARGFQKEIYVNFGDPNPQKHNFCPRGDIDLAFFRVKRSRWYRVSTTNLAPGVDTVMAVGDLDNSTPCQPGGCWNDDRGALTYESQIVFQAVEDDTAIITVDNRGTNYGTEATYELSVVEFSPEATPTVSPVASPTPTPTDTATPTPLPLRDPYEPNDTCNTATDSPRLAPGPVETHAIFATLLTNSDEDWFETVALMPGQYILRMRPPAGQDYDMDLRYNDDVRSRRRCPTSGYVGHYRPEGVEEVIAFEVQASQTAGQSFVVRVYPRPYSRSFDPHNTYRLWLHYAGSPPPPPPPTPTITPTPSATPTVTPTPTITPPAVRPPLP